MMTLADFIPDGTFMGRHRCDNGCIPKGAGYRKGDLTEGTWQHEGKWLCLKCYRRAKGWSRPKKNEPPSED